MALARGIATALGRPFAAATWRELAYLLVGGAMSVAAFGEVVGMVTGSLVVTESAVEKHVRSVFAKLRLPSSEDDNRRVLAVLAYLREVG